MAESKQAQGVVNVTIANPAKNFEAQVKTPSQSTYGSVGSYGVPLYGTPKCITPRQ